MKDSNMLMSDSNARLPSRLVNKTGLVVLILGSLLIPTRTVRADGVLPVEMEFEFVYETQSPLTIVEFEHFLCAQPTCTAKSPTIRCSDERCFSQVHYLQFQHEDIISDHFPNRLVIRFSDGIIRESNVFYASHIMLSTYAKYRVTVRESDLVVENKVIPLIKHIQPNYLDIIIKMVACQAVAPLVVVVLLIVKEEQNKTSRFARGPFIAAWVITVPVSLFSYALYPSLLATLIIEGIIAFIYASLRGRSRFTLLTLVTLVNVITQLLLLLQMLLLQSVGARVSYAVAIGLGEVLIWWVEAVLLYLAQRKTLSFKEALGLSLILNIASFGIGLLLSV